MANVFQDNKYNPSFYANEALMHFHEELGMAKRSFWGYAEEHKGAVPRGDSVTITVAGLLTASNDPTSDPDDLVTGKRVIYINTPVKVEFAVTDTQIAFGTDQIISDHVSEALYRVSENLDGKLISLCGRIPYRVAADTNSNPKNDFINARQLLRRNGVKVDRTSEMLHYAVDDVAEADLLRSDLYTSVNVVGSYANEALLKGSLSPRLNISPFIMQSSTVSHTCGTIATQGSQEGAALVGDHAIDATTLTLDGATATLTVKANDSLVIAGNSQKYVATADAVVAADGTVTLSVDPPLIVPYSDNAEVLFDETPVAGGSFVGLPLFHTKAFAVVPVALPDHGKNLGANVATVTDPETGLSIRATLSYDATGEGSVRVKYDARFGVMLIDPRRATLVCRAP